MTAVHWLSPSPLWKDFTSDPARVAFRRPALLRFASDSFMDDLESLLKKQSADLRRFVAQPETWREPIVGLDADPTAGGTKTPPPFSLYQPLHNRFYLVTAQLTCRVPGLPDHTIAPADEEKVTFLLRRVLPLGENGDVFDPAKRSEQAWIAGEPAGWRPVSGAGLETSEETLPLFPMTYTETGNKRRLFAGLIPTGKRQTYATARALPAPGAISTPDDPRVIDFQRKVIDPWAELIDLNGNLSAAEKANAAIAFSIYQGSALILLDFANFLYENLKPVWDAVDGGSPPPAGPGLTLYQQLAATLLPKAGGGSVALSDALAAARRHEADLESAVLQPGQTPALPSGVPSASLLGASPEALMAKVDPQPRPIATLIGDALGAPPANAPAPRIPAKDPAGAQGNDWFVARCAYLRPKCGAGGRPVLSEPTRPFRLASVFDPDAPARPSQVALPLDTTPAALRKHDKSVAFVISDELAKQMARIKGLKALTEGDVDGPQLGIGMICSLSIPIITLCAFIVLMIFISLLNIIFWWLPFFKICFPIPTLKAKGA